ncbi:MAG: hypothetical protein R3F17_16675 [Planctomycetota bacterium]
MKRLPSAAFLVLGVLSLLLPACQYRAGLKLPPQYATYGVEIFSNSSLEPDLERRLHPYLTRTLADHAGARLVSPAGADACVRGKILSSLRRPGIRSPENEWLESANQTVIQAELWDEHRGRAVARTQVFVQVGFVFDTEGGGATAQEYALQNAAERVVIELLQQVDAQGPTPLKGDFAHPAE